VVAHFGQTYASDALSTSFDRTFAFITILTLLGVIPALFLRRPEKTAAGHVAAARCRVRSWFSAAPTSSDRPSSTRARARG